MFLSINSEYHKYKVEHKSWKNGVFAAFVIISVFLLLNPFGFEGKDVWLKLVLIPSYATISFFNSLLVFFLVRKYLDRHRVWTIKKELMVIPVDLVVVSVVVHIVSWYVTGDMPFNFEWYFRLFFHVTSIYLIIGIIEFFYYNHIYVVGTNKNLSSEYSQIKKQLNSIEMQKEEFLTIFLENEQIEVKRSKLIYILSNSNYLELFLYETNGAVKKIIKRGRMHQAEKDLAGYSEFFRCHRAYIVNLDKVDTLKGNMKNARLTFACTDHEIPVSRSLYKSIKKKLEKSILS